MGSTSTIIWGMIFGSIGFGYFLYGKKQKRTMPFIAGLGLMIFPYFFSSTLWLLLVGAALTALPLVVKL